MSNIKSFAEKFVGQKIAVLCARYQYRGVLTEVADDHIVLSNSRAVESSGASKSNTPSSEDPIDSEVMISLGAVEIIYQPNWANAPLTNET
jgi:hypothetical protein